MPNQSQVRGQISELVHLAPIKKDKVPGREIRYADRLRTTLEAFNRRDEQGFPSVIRQFRGIHAAKWALVDGDTRLLTSVVFDGTLHGYLRALARDIPGMLHMIWSNCEGWEDPRNDGQHLIDFIERHQVRANFFFAQHPQLTVPDVEALLRMRDVVQQGEPAKALQAELYRGNRPISSAKRLEDALAKYDEDGMVERSKKAFAALFSKLYTQDEVARAIVETYGGAAAPAQHARSQPPDTEIQGNVLAEYADAHCARMIFFRFGDQASARQWLHSLRAKIQFGREDPKASCYLNVGFTHAGLATLGVSAAVLSDFPDAFVEGMEARAALLDDPARREPLPRHWTVVRDAVSPVHAVVFLHARVERDGELYPALVEAGKAAQANAEAPFEGKGDAVGRDARLSQFVAAHLDRLWEQLPPELLQLGAAGRLGHQDLHRPLVKCESDPERPYGVEYFGFRDGIGQPQTHESVLRLEGRGLLANSTFLVARKLLQHPTAFWKGMAEQAEALNVTKRELAEQIVGRRMDGRRLASTEKHYDPKADLHAFNPEDEVSGCPFHSHVRRVNPRVENNLTRNPTLMRRSLAYLDSRQAESARGLMFLAFNADIETQFELIQRNWLHAGNQVGLAARDRDVLVGLAVSTDLQTDRGPARFYAELPDKNGSPSQLARELQFKDAFVELEWGLYLYFPARTALNQL